MPLVYRILPFHDDIESIRYTIGVQAAGNSRSLSMFFQQCSVN